MSADSDDLRFATRIWFSFACFWRVLLQGDFARAVWSVAHDAARPALAEAPAAPSPVALPAPSPPTPPSITPSPDAALQLLAILQREGRLIDFLEQDVATFTDADIGAAARVVHEGCRRALRAHAKLAPVRSEDEGARVTVAADVTADEVKLTGNVQGTAPYTGVLRHRGWRATDLTLPTVVRAYDARVLAPAEVEL